MCGQGLDFGRKVALHIFRLPRPGFANFGFLLLGFKSTFVQDNLLFVKFVVAS